MHYAPRKLVRFPVPEAHRLASLGSISSDLHAVLRYCTEAIQASRDHAGPSVEQALREAAVVRYGRCFATGVRAPLPRDLFELAPDGVRVSHEHFIDVRNKHVAHSVNEYEETDVVILLEKVGHRYEIFDVGTAHVQRSALDGSDLPRLMELTKWLLEEVENLSEAERKLLFDLALRIGRGTVSKYKSARTGGISLRARNANKRRKASDA